MTVKVGWVQMLEHERFSLMQGVIMSPYLMFDPEKYTRIPQIKHGRWRFTSCPAYTQFNRNMYIIKSPVNLHLKCIEGQEYGRWEIRPEQGTEFNVNGEAIYRLIELAEDPGGRVDFDKPHLQFRMGYAFFADKPVTIQLIPIVSEPTSYPGITIPGEFDIHAWHRQINWAFEWHDTTKPLIIKRGQPLFAVKFIVHDDPSEKVELVKLKMSKQIVDAILRTSNVPSFVKNTFKLFEKARLMRPKKFITEDNLWNPGD